jgi:glycosyltransferase involved in cell wall biosynthesis
MRIAIDARLVSARDMGSSVYCRSLLRALAARPDGDEYQLICTSSAGRGMELGAHCHWVESPGARLMDEEWEQLALPALLQELRPDAFLSLTGVLPAVKACPQATIIHDAGVEEEPGFYATPLFRYLSKWLRAAASQADLVITVSRHAAAGIQRAYGVPRERMIVASPAADDIFWPIPEEERNEVLDGYEVAAPYLIAVAAMEPNRNLSGVLDAYQLAGGRAGTGLPLVLVGGAGAAEPSLLRQIATLGIADDVILAGYVRREHLPALYSAATCFLWASLYEGFGLPPLEAMACGTPVVSSNRTSMPEVLGEAAILVDPLQPAAMAAALKLLLSSDQLRQRLRRAGLQRAARYSWQQTAQTVLEGLERVAIHG